MISLDAARGLNNRLSQMDQDKLDEYFSSVVSWREEIEREEKNWGPSSSNQRPDGIPG